LSRKLVLGLTPATIILGCIIALSAFLHLYNMDAIGDANLYYTAAVKAMLQSWKNFFFVAAEPGGSVSVDKPPLGLWIETLSAYFLGVNGFAVVLPNIIAGLLSIVVLYHLVKRYYGTGAGLIAALVVAVTPVAIVAERNNTADGMLTFCLVLAAWAFLNATDTGQRRYLWLGALLVGLGFNIKMLQAYLVLPALYGLYFFGAQAGWGRKILNLAVATVIVLVVSLAWALAVDLTPADQRPYVGGSTNNSVMELIVGYNGVQRLLGMRFGRMSSVASLFGGGQAQGNSSFGGGQPPAFLGNGSQSIRPNDGPGQGSALPNFVPRQDRGPGAGFGGPGGVGETGEKGVTRFFLAPLSKEMSWLLPFALVGMVVTLFSRKLRWPLEPDPRTVVLWGGWLVTGLVFFSIAGFFHAYYLVMLTPPLAALVGSGAATVWQMRDRHRWLATLILIGAGGATLAFQWFNARQFDVGEFWLPLSVMALLAGAVLLVLPQTRRWRAAGFTTVVAAMMIVPFAWSVLTNLHSANSVLPGAYQGETRAGFGPGGGRTDFGPGGERTVNAALLTFLEANTQDVKYLMAVPASMQGAGYVLATGRPVLYMGGFGGADPVVSADDLAQLIATGELRYVLGGGGRGGPGGMQSDISSWLESACTVVDDVSVTTNSTGFGRFGGGTVLYDCAG
jgi:4-amino-4-deoxy-L-arabinose transferase-like glycosyltransferase